MFTEPLFPSSATVTALLERSEERREEASKLHRPLIGTESSISLSEVIRDGISVCHPPLAWVRHIIVVASRLH